MRRFILGLAALWLALLAGCGESSPPGGGQSAPAASTSPAASALGEFRFVSPDEHNFLDPQKMSWLHDIRVAECLFEPLLRVNVPDLTVGPAVAEKWELSDDKLIHTFHLRAEAKWSNGEPVKASDFVFAWERMAVPDFAADYSQLFFRIKGVEAHFKHRAEQLKKLAQPVDHSSERLALAKKTWDESHQHFLETVGIKAPDDRTLVVTLEQPTAYFPDLVAFVSFVPLHPASVSKGTSFNADTGMLTQDATYWSDPSRLVSNGPYKLESRRPGRELRMTQNPHHWNRAAMKNGAIVELIGKDPAAQMQMYRSGMVDWVPDLPTASPLAADMIARKSPDAITSTWAGTYFYNFNCNPTLPDGKKNPLADARVRRALSMGIDRKTIVTQVTRLNQPEARTFIPPGALAGYDAPADAGSAFDIADAKKLLADAGYPDGKGLDGLSILFNTNAGHENIAQEIKRSWQENLGVSVRLEGMETQSFKDRLKSHRFTISRASWIGDYPDATTFLDKFVSDNGNNDAAYTSAEFDKLMQDAAAQLDPKARLALLRKAEALMLADQPVAPIFHYVTLHIYDPAKVSGIHPNIWNQRRLEFVSVQR